MKKVILTLACLSLYAGAMAQNRSAATPASAASMQAQPANAAQVAAPTPPPVDKNAGIFKFKEETHDFGEVNEGPTSECDFEFKNVGKKPIVITEAHGSCGCTVPKWPQEPILPGKTGKIHVTYNTAGRPGPISKTVTITSNAQTPSMVLRIAGTVKPKPATPEQPNVPQPDPNK